MVQQFSQLVDLEKLYKGYLLANIGLGASLPTFLNIRESKWHVRGT